MVRKKGFLVVFIVIVIISFSCVSVISNYPSPRNSDSKTNTIPKITSENLVYAAGDILFEYTIDFTDPDGPDTIIYYNNYPSWITRDDDRLFGIPSEGMTDTSFTVTVSDGKSAMTLVVNIVITPCLVVYGDCRTNHDVHRKLVDSIIDLKPKAVFNTGDLVANGNSVDNWNMFNSITPELRSVADYYPALGNHEYQSDLFFGNFDLPNNEQWYSVEINNTHFIVLNSNVATGIGSEQYQWLETDLAGVHDSIKFIAAVFHHPPYSTGRHTEDEKGLRDTFVPLFEQYNVDIVFNGHDHDYERSYCGDIYYIVTGGGGAPLRDQFRVHPCSQLFQKTYHFCRLSIIDDLMVIRVYDLNRQLIDQFELYAD